MLTQSRDFGHIPAVSINMALSSVSKIFTLLIISSLTLGAIVASAPTPDVTADPTLHQLSRRDETINLEPGINFETCTVNHRLPGMCTVSFVEHSSWMSNTVIMVNDVNCKRIGTNTAVPRDYLAAPGGWGMSSELPMQVSLSFQDI